MTNTQTGTVNLAQVVAGLNNLDKTAAYRRFHRLLEFIGEDREEHKDENGEFWFHPEEEEFVRGILAQMDKPYLVDLLKHKPYSKETLAECCQKSMDFRQAMQPIVAEIQYKPLREWCWNVTEMLARRRPLQWLRHNIEGFEVDDLNLPTETSLEIVSLLEQHLAKWKSELLGKSQRAE